MKNSSTEDTLIQSHLTSERCKVSQLSSKMSPTHDNGQSSPELDKEISESREASWNSFGKRIIFYAPSFSMYRNRCFPMRHTTFPSISLTGTNCALQCEHCKGRFLEKMIPATSPDSLRRVLQEIKRKGSGGCLISGGCEAGGSVPITQFLPVIAQAKIELGLRIVIHTGLLDVDSSRQLADSNVDCALIDVIGFSDTAREVCHMNVEITRYRESLSAPTSAGVKTVPHVIVGLDYGELKGEYEAIRMIAGCDPAAVVIIALTPIKRTGMEGLSPPTPETIASVLTRARELMPKVPLVLGCVRPTGIHRATTDTLAMRSGVNGIVFPTSRAIQLARREGIEHHFSSQCCALIYEDLENTKSISR